MAVPCSAFNTKTNNILRERERERERDKFTV